MLLNINRSFIYKKIFNKNINYLYKIYNHTFYTSNNPPMLMMAKASAKNKKVNARVEQYKKAKALGKSIDELFDDDEDVFKSLKAGERQGIENMKDFLIHVYSHKPEEVEDLRTDEEKNLKMIIY